MADADNADDLVLIANTPTQAKSLRHSREQSAEGTGLHVNATKTEYVCLKKKGPSSLVSL